jgi:hypothetical protein
MRSLWEKAEGIPLELRGAMASAFYGGRVEASLVGIACPMVLIDISGTYPWAFSAAGLTELYACDEIDFEEMSPLALMELLDTPGVDRERAVRLGQVFALAKPCGEVLPATVEWEPDRIGSTITSLDLCGLTLCYHGADLQAAFIEGGSVPEITRAWRLVCQGGDEQSRFLRLPTGRMVDLMREDLGDALTEERAVAKGDHSRPFLEGLVKLFGVSVTFGLLARADRRLKDSLVREIAYGPAGQAMVTETMRPEEPGPFSFVPGAAAVCATARLAVTSAKRAVEDLGGVVAHISVDALAIPASPTGGLWPCPGGALRLLDGREAIRLLSFEEIEGITEVQKRMLGVRWKAVAETVAEETMGVVAGVNKLILGRVNCHGGWEVVRSSDADMGGHLLDPTGKGEKTADDRWAWAAEIEGSVLEAAIECDPPRPLVPASLPTWAGRLSLRRYRAATWPQLVAVREAVGDPRVCPFTDYVVCETGGKGGGPIAIGRMENPEAWPGLDFRLDGERVALVSSSGHFLAGMRGARRQVVVRTVADHLERWLDERDPSMEGPRRGLRHPVPVRSHLGLFRVVGKAGETVFADEVDPDRDPVEPQLVYGTLGIEDLRRKAIVLGRREIGRRTGKPASRFQRFLQGSGTSDETLSLFAEAIEMEVPIHLCAAPGCGRPARHRSLTCSEACRKSRARLSGRVEGTGRECPPRQPGGPDVPPPPARRAASPTLIQAAVNVGRWLAQAVASGELTRWDAEAIVARDYGDEPLTAAALAAMREAETA